MSEPEMRTYAVPNVPPSIGMGELAAMLSTVSNESIERIFRELPKDHLGASAIAVSLATLLAIEHIRAGKAVPTGGDVIIFAFDLLRAMTGEAQFAQLAMRALENRHLAAAA